MNDVLVASLEPVLRDIRTTGAPTPEVRDDDWGDDRTTASAMLCSTDGTGMGVSVQIDDAEPDRVAAVADQVQEWVIEQSWRQATTNWPRCPRHRSSHPLRATVRTQAAVWICATDDAVVAPIGALP